MSGSDEYGPGSCTMAVETHAGQGGTGGGLAAVGARIDFRELRMALEPSAFPELERDVRAYWAMVKSVARRSSAVVSESPSSGTPSFRELVYHDTPAADLRRRGHLLFTRARIVRGAPTSGFQLALSFRAAELAVVAAAGVVAAPQYEGGDVLREEIGLGPHATVTKEYSRTCTLREHRWEVGPRLSDVGRIFPALGDLPLLPTLPIRPVGEAPIEELHVALGEIDFGTSGGRIALDIWRDTWSGETLSVDLSIESPFGRFQRAAGGEKLRCASFERLLLEESGAKVAPMRGRADVVYGRIHRRAAGPG